MVKYQATSVINDEYVFVTIIDTDTGKIISKEKITLDRYDDVELSKEVLELNRKNAEKRYKEQDRYYDESEW